VGLLGAIALHTVTAWILGLVKARPGWYGAIMAPLFIVSATVSGVALLLVSVVFCRRVLGLPIEARVIRSLGKLLALVIPVLGYFLFAELLTVLYAKEPAALQVFDEMMFGRYAPVFWGNLILGLMAPLAILVATLLDLSRRLVAAGAGIGIAIVMLAAAGGNLPVPRPLLWTVVVAGILLVLLRYVSPETRIGAAATLVVLGVLAERWNIVVPPLIGFSHLPYPPGHYAPTGTELLLVAGVYAIGGILFAFAARILPLVESE
jgi:molybdopterin-containing oxidoreductase family membrane subunit